MLDRLTFAGVVTSTDFIEERSYTYDVMGDILSARLKSPNLPARGNFVTGLTSSSTSYTNRGSFNPLTGLGETTTNYQAKSFIPFDLGFQSPPNGVTYNGDKTTWYAYPTNHVRPHAVSSTCKVDTTAGQCSTAGNSYTYDANGSMTQRIENGVTWTQTFDAENHLISVSDGTTTTQYVYDADGNRVKRIVGGTTTTYVAGMEIELTGSATKTTVYYAAGGAFRVIGGTDPGLYFRLTDHLGSTSLVTDASGVEKANSRVVYAPFGEVRSGQQSTLTDFGYTGQRHDDSDGLMYYGARYYLPGIQHFISADSVTSGSSTSQGLNRYAYVNNNPMKYSDPTGHMVDDDVERMVVTLRTKMQKMSQSGKTRSRSFSVNIIMELIALAWNEWPRQRLGHSI